MSPRGSPPYARWKRLSKSLESEGTLTICYICCEYPPLPHGGIGSFVQTLGRGFVKQGDKVRVLGLYSNGGKFGEFEEDQGVEVWRFPCPDRRLAWVPARYRLFRTIQNWAKRGEIDILEVPDWQGYAAGWPRLDVPLVVRLHGSITYFASEMSEPIGKRALWLESRAFHRADFCCSTSAYTARRTNELLGARPDDIRVLYTLVNIPPKIETSERSPTRVVFAGTLTRKKGILQLIKAWPLVLEQRPDAELHVYGKDGGTDERQLRKMLSERDSNSVHFYGHIRTEELRNVYRTARLAVFPSYTEAFALAPIEAMAEACPVIYSKLHSGPELITHGHDGFLVDPDDLRALSDDILGLLNDDELACRLGRRGRERAEARFSPGPVVERNRRYYQECIDSFR
ncbi:MAG: glycosyltransferase family 4 protein [Candidatus Solibacter sp.]